MPTFLYKGAKFEILVLKDGSMEGHQNCIIGSKVTVILLNWSIEHIGGVASGRVCTCSLRSRLVYIRMPNFEMAVLKDDSMEVHYIGSYRMHPDRSSCLGSSANG